MLYCSISWSECTKENIMKIFRLQKRYAGVILDARPRHSIVYLSIRLGWLPFNLESDIKKCILAYKRTIGETPDYINKLLIGDLGSIVSITAEELGVSSHRSFTVTASKLWNNLPLKFTISDSTRRCWSVYLGVVVLSVFEHTR